MDYVKILVVAAALLLLPSSSFASTITLIKKDAAVTEGECSIALDGPIEKGDLDRLRHIASSNGLQREYRLEDRQYLLCLNSPGGSYIEGLQVAQYVLENGVGTRIEESASCLSACALIFMAGTTRGSTWEYPYRFLHVQGRLGFHAPYLTLKETDTYSAKDAEAVFDLSNRLMAGFIKIFSFQGELYTDPWIRNSLIAEMFGKGRDEILYVDTVDQVGRWQITLFGKNDAIKPTLRGIGQVCYNFLGWAQDRPGSKYEPGTYGTTITKDSKSGYYRVHISGMEDAYCDVGIFDNHIRICSIDNLSASNRGQCPDRYWVLNSHDMELPGTSIRSLK